MKRFIPRRPTPAMVVALIALIAALGGTAVAGGFLKTKKFKKFKGEVNKELARGLRGPITYMPSTVQIPPGANNLPVTSPCLTGTHVVGGGIKAGGAGTLDVNDSYPTTSGWAGRVSNLSLTEAAPAFVIAICAEGKTNGAPPSS